MGTVADTIISMAMNILMIFISIILGGAIIWGTYKLYTRRMRYRQFSCVIWERDGFGQLQETTDLAGIFVDNKTKNKRLYLKKNNVGLNPDNIPYIQSGNKKIIYFYKSGLKNFHFININIAKPKITITTSEEDVNWGINAYDRAKKLFNQSLLMQLMPYIALFFVSMIILTLFIFLFKQFDGIKELFQAITEFTNALNIFRGGTTVMPS